MNIQIKYYKHELTYFEYCFELTKIVAYLEQCRNVGKYSDNT